jgi:hypothetical protein
VAFEFQYFKADHEACLSNLEFDFSRTRDAAHHEARLAGSATSRAGSRVAFHMGLILAAGARRTNATQQASLIETELSMPDAR